MVDEADSRESRTNIDLPKVRSPAYPYISLDVAVERVRKIYTQVQTFAQPRQVLAKAYGKPASSSATIQTFATLLQYGLLENVSEGGTRRMRVSSLARDILNPHAPSGKVAEARRIAALRPPIFAELWSAYGDTKGLNDSVPLFYLTSDREKEHGASFTQKAALEVLRVYRATLEYAEIENGHVNAEFVDEPAVNGEPIPPIITELAQSPPPRDERQPSSPTASLPLTQGERELQAGILSKDGATYRVIVSGKIGVREIERLIAKLTLDKEILAEDSLDT